MEYLPAQGRLGRGAAASRRPAPKALPPDREGPRRHARQLRPGCPHPRAPPPLHLPPRHGQTAASGSARGRDERARRGARSRKPLPLRRAHECQSHPSARRTRQAPPLPKAEAIPPSRPPPSRTAPRRPSSSERRGTSARLPTVTTRNGSTARAARATVRKWHVSRDIAARRSVQPATSTLRLEGGRPASGPGARAGRATG